jgi:hypothetical protein
LRPGPVRLLPVQCARRTALGDGRKVTQENARLRFITDELGHRIKNLLGSFSRSRGKPCMKPRRDDFETRFFGRLGALGHCHDLLITNNWCGARIDELVRLELTPFGALEGCRFR